MKNKSPEKSKVTLSETRDDRLKSALKANIAKRKEQARSRANAHGGDQKRVAEAKVNKD